MITITKNLKSFIEDYNTELIIYGAGNSGYWVGYYMNRCNVDFGCYIDSKVENEGCLYNEKPIYTACEKLKEYKGQSIRIFVSPTEYKAVVFDLLQYSQDYGFSAVCYVPVGYSITDMDSANRIETYSINDALSYFRKKVFQGTIPTILCNDCTAGGIYQTLGLPMISPTINVVILEDDFIKLCTYPEHYFEIEVTSFEYERITVHRDGKTWCADVPCSKIDDIKIYWVHSDGDGRALKRWNIMRKKVNYDNIICVMSNSRIQISQKGWDSFSKITRPHFSFMYKDKYVTPIDSKNTIVGNTAFPLWRMDTVIENYFDVLGFFSEQG